MGKHGSNTIIKYIKQIKNEDIRDIQRSLDGRFSNIENREKLKLKLRKTKNLAKLQQQSERSRENYFTEKGIIKKSSVYFSPKFVNFNDILLYLIGRSTTKQSVKKVFSKFQLAIPNNLSGLFLHLICSILGKVDDGITLTNCRIQMRNLLEKNYILFAEKSKSVNLFDAAKIKKSGW